ncbi:hypothetical protein G6F35_019084 [Rhizopus arrhizus]|nr:hypothetical protein G6F35_019084 [Rhizopus arrhizus]
MGIRERRCGDRSGRHGPHRAKRRACRGARRGRRHRDRQRAGILRERAPGVGPAGAAAGRMVPAVPRFHALLPAAAARVVRLAGG